MMHFDEYMELFRTPESVSSPEEEFMEWAVENCPEPTEEELANQYEELL